MNNNFNIRGEILIPLENTFTNKEIEIENIEDVLDYDIHQFRGLIFQNELMRFFIALRNNNNNHEEFEKLVNETEIKVELFPDGESIIDNSNNDDNSEYNSHGMISINIKEGKEGITRRKICKEKTLALIEVKKQIIIPNMYINTPVTLIVYLKNSALLQPNDADIDLSDLGKIIKKKNLINPNYLRLSKKIKVIRPLFVFQSKQFDFSPNVSILQVKLENITSKVNFIDVSLKENPFLSKTQHNDFDNGLEFLDYGIDMTIDEMSVAKDDIVIDGKILLDITKGEQTYQKENGRFMFDGPDVELINKDFPVTVRPGEEINITLKVIKKPNDGLFEMADSKEEEDIPKDEATNNSPEGKHQSHSQKKKESFLSRLGRMRKGNHKEQRKSSLLRGMNEKMPPATAAASLNTILNPLTPPEKDKIIKISLSTPLVIQFHSNEDVYSNMYMTVMMKWKTDVSNGLSLTFSLPKEPLVLNHPFQLVFSFTSTFSSTYVIDFPSSYTSCDFLDKPFNQNFPELLPEYSQYNITISPNSVNNLTVTFLPIKVGYLSLPTFNITEPSTKKKLFVVHTNKLYISEK